MSEMMVKPNINPDHKPPKLTNRKRAAIQHYLVCKTNRELCAAAGISDSTRKRYEDDPEFMRELEKARAEVIGGAMRKLKDNVTKVADTLVDMLDSGSPWLKLRVCETILATVGQLRDEELVSQRLEVVERLILERRTPI